MKSLIKNLLVGLSIILANYSFAGTDSTSVIVSKPNPTPTYGMILDSGVTACIYANYANSSQTTTWPTTSKRCPADTLAQLTLSYKATCGLLPASSKFRAFSLNCAFKNITINNDVYCIDARIYGASPGPDTLSEDAWITVYWVIHCIPI